MWGLLFYQGESDKLCLSLCRWAQGNRTTVPRSKMKDFNWVLTDNWKVRNASSSHPHKLVGSSILPGGKKCLQERLQCDRTKGEGVQRRGMFHTTLRERQMSRTEAVTRWGKEQLLCHFLHSPAPQGWSQLPLCILVALRPGQPQHADPFLKAA